MLLAVVKQDLEILLVGGHALSSSRLAVGDPRAQYQMYIVHRTSGLLAIVRRMRLTLWVG